MAATPNILEHSYNTCGLDKVNISRKIHEKLRFVEHHSLEQWFVTGCTFTKGPVSSFKWFAPLRALQHGKCLNGRVLGLIYISIFMVVRSKVEKKLELMHQSVIPNKWVI